jgi:hypothetical protein
MKQPTRVMGLRLAAGSSVGFPERRGGLDGLISNGSRWRSFRGRGSGPVLRRMRRLLVVTIRARGVRLSSCACCTAAAAVERFSGRREVHGSHGSWFTAIEKVGSAGRAANRGVAGDEAWLRGC